MNVRYSIEFTPTVSDQPEWWRVTLELDGHPPRTIEGPMPDPDIERLTSLLATLLYNRQGG